jgi:iron complex outermembrane recepter protein
VTTSPVTVTITPTNQPVGAPATVDFTRVTVTNGDSAKVYGIEAGGQYFFDNGFGISANATYNHSRATSGTLTTQLPGAIPFSANVKLFYEKHGLDAQVSYNYAASYTQAQKGLIPGLPITEDTYHEVSASLGYEIIPNVKVYIEGSNLANQAIKRFYTYRNVPAFYEASGRSFFFGVRARY